MPLSSCSLTACVLLGIALCASSPCRGEWLTKHHKEAPWETTSDPADLDAAGAKGAVILRFADGSYVHAIHRQYPQSCGPSSLAMMLRQLGYDDPTTPLRLPQDVDALPDTKGPTVDVGYVGSMEHLMWLGLRRLRLQEGMADWNNAEPLLMSPEGVLNTEPIPGKLHLLNPNGEMDHLPFVPEGVIPSWLWRSPGIGTRTDDNGWDKLPGIMNYVVAGVWGKGCKDARPRTIFSRTDDEVRAFRRSVKGYIDHGISLLLGVEAGGHFNVIIGYHGDTEDVAASFHLYTADPLDGWGRPEERQPGRWRRLDAVAENMFNGRGLMTQYVCWNQHLDGGCEPEGWAREVDERNGNEWLCGRPVPVEDPLGDAITITQ